MVKTVLNLVVGKSNSYITEVKGGYTFAWSFQTNFGGLI